MNALEKNRWICFGKEATYAKDSRIAALQITSKIRLIISRKRRSMENNKN